MENITIVTRKLPAGVRGTVTPNDDGSWTIFVNASLTEEQRQRTIQHELNHIQRCDFGGEDQIDQIEYQRHADGDAQVGDHIFYYIY